MKIVVDSNILYAEKVFSEYGDLFFYKNKIENRDVLKDADVLLCRSTMKVNKDLLEGTNIKFVATATSGIEHLDIDFLNERKIEFCDAKGSNSNSVAEYVIAALLELSHRYNFELVGKTLGIVGWGCVGKKVEKKAKALGLNVLVNDPPLDDKKVEKDFVPLDDILKCDIITLHVPLNNEGKYKTLDLFNNDKFSKMKKGSIFINTSRGKVVNENDLVDAIKNNVISYAVLDVWQNEPDINIDILKYINISTPHIAGHSLDAKALGTEMILDKFCSYFNFQKRIDVLKLLPEPDIFEEEINGYTNLFEKLRNIIVKIYDINKDDLNFRRIISQSNIKEYFNYLRNNYWPRREFYNTSIKTTNQELKNVFEQIGFNIKL